MDTEKIVQDLNRRFAAPLPEFYKRRVIFWYDEDREFEDKLDEIQLDDAQMFSAFRCLPCKGKSAATPRTLSTV